MTDWYAEVTGAAKAPPETPGGTDWYAEVTNPRPTQAIGAAPAGTPRIGRPEPADTLDTRFRVGQLARGSLPPDIPTQIKRLSESSGIPEDRFGVIGGNIVYADDDGTVKRVTPSVFGGDRAQGLAPYLGETAQRAARWMFSGAGPAIPQAAGIGAGLAMGPTGKSIPITGAAAAAADVGRQVLDKALAGESLLTTDYDALNALGHGAQAASGQAIGVGINRLLQRNPLGVSTYDRAQAVDPARRAQAAALEAEAKRRGVNLSGGQATDLRSLKVQERRLGRFDETADRMADFAETQRGTQVPRAVREEIGQISPLSGERAIKAFRQGAEDTAQTALSARSALARKAYEALDTAPPYLDDNLKKLLDRPSMGDAWAAAKRLAAEEGRPLPQYIQTDPTTGKMTFVKAPDWRSWDYIKRGLDTVIEGNTNELGRVNSVGRAVSMTRREMLNTLDAALPDYKAARALYGTASDAVDAILEGGVGFVRGIQGMDRQGIVNRAFSATNITAEEVGRMRNQFAMAGKLGDFNAGLASFLSDKLAVAMKPTATASTAGNVPGKLYASVWGDERQQAIVRAALGDQGRVQSMERLMQVLRAASRSLPEGSPTATDLPAMTTGESVGTGLKVLGKLTSPGTALNLGNEIVEGVSALRTPQARIKLAEALLSGNYDRELGKLRVLPVGGQKAVNTVSQILTSIGVTSAGSRLFPPAERAPSAPSTIP